MKILNVHERTLPVAVDKVLPLFHSLSSDKDLSGRWKIGHECVLNKDLNLGQSAGMDL